MAGADKKQRTLMSRSREETQNMVQAVGALGQEGNVSVPLLSLTSKIPRLDAVRKLNAIPPDLAEVL